MFDGMKFISDESYHREDGNLYLHFEAENGDELEWVTMVSQYLNRYSTRQLSGRSLKVAYKYPVLKAHFGEWLDGSIELPRWTVYSDEVVMQINDWLKQEAIYRMEEEHD